MPRPVTPMLRLSGPVAEVPGAEVEPAGPSDGLRRLIEPPPAGTAWPALARATTRRALWAALLELLRERITFAEALLAFPYEESWPAEITTTATPRRGAKDFYRLIADSSPAAQFTDAHPEVLVAEASEALGPVLWEQTAHYRELFIPQGWYYSLAFFFRRRGRFFARIALTRKRSQGNFSAQERATAEALHPHFAAAIERIWKIESQANAAGVLARTLRGLPQALALFDPDGKLLWATRAAETEIARWGGRLSKDSSLNLPAPAAQALATLRAAGSRRSLEGPGSPPLLCRHPERPDLRLYISAEPPVAPGGQPLFFLHFLEAGTTPCCEAGLRWLALLTPGERRVAEAVCDGLKKQEVATHLGLSVHTVSAHLRQVYAKLDVHSRHALVARLASSA